MKQLFLLFILLIFVQIAKAQDILFLKTGEELNVKILTISDSQVSYKYSSGETFTIPQKQIFKIKYENGNIELFVKKKERKQTISNDKKALFYLLGSYAGSYQLSNSWAGNNVYKTTIDTINTKQTSGVYGTLGNGFNWNVGFGVLFKNKIGFEFAYLNFTGNKLVFENSTNIQNTLPYFSINDNTNTTNRLDYSAFSGSLIMKHHWFYGKIGLIIANTIIYIDSAFSRTNKGVINIFDSTHTSNSEMTAPFQLGFTGGVGINIPLTKHLDLFAETNYMMMNVQPDKLHFTKITDNYNEKQKPDDVNLVESSDGKIPNELIRKTFSINSWNWVLGMKILF